MPTTLLQLTDTHLDTADAAHMARWQIIRDTIIDANPDRLIVTGDLTDDGLLEQNAHLLTDFRDLLDALDIPYHVLPGNHDIGNRVGFSHPVNQPALDRWLNVFAHHTFAINDIPGWQILGLDTMILGSDLNQVEPQRDWLKQQLDRTKDAPKKLLVFTHAPLFLNKPDEKLPSPSNYWCPPEPARDEIWQILTGSGRLRYLIHGHLHHPYLVDPQSKNTPQLSDPPPPPPPPTRIGAPPAVGIIVEDPLFPTAAREHGCGMMLYTLFDDNIEIAPIALDIPTRKTKLSLES